MAQGAQGQGSWLRLDYRTLNETRWTAEHINGRHLYNNERGVAWALKLWKQRVSWRQNVLQVEPSGEWWWGLRRTICIMRAMKEGLNGFIGCPLERKWLSLQIWPGLDISIESATNFGPKLRGCWTFKFVLFWSLIIESLLIVYFYSIPFYRIEGHLTFNQTKFPLISIWSYLNLKFWTWECLTFKFV